MRSARALLLLLALAACTDGNRPDLQRMIEQPRGDVYEPSGFFADGKVMQPAPSGTVARGDLTDPAISDGAVGGVPLDTVPLPVTPALLRIGEGRFGIYCAACHGAGGYGGSVVAMNMQPPRPPSLHSDSILTMPAGILYQTITRGFGRMPGFAGELSVDERWAVVAYVEALGHSPARTAAAREDSSRAASIGARRIVPPAVHPLDPNGARR